MYYDRGADGVPSDWMRRVKQSIRHLSRQFNCQRTVAEYTSQLYDPAHASWLDMRGNGFEKVRKCVEWNAGVARVWDRVKIVETELGPEGVVISGKPIEVRAAVDLAGLAPNDVRVEAVIGRIGPGGHLEHSEVLTLPPAGQRDSVHLFAREILLQQTGRLGYAVRVAPNHYDDPLTRSCDSLLKWAAGHTERRSG
jgi:starch phosphorylase